MEMNAHMRLINHLIDNCDIKHCHQLKLTTSIKYIKHNSCYKINDPTLYYGCASIEHFKCVPLIYKWKFYKHVYFIIYNNNIIFIVNQKLQSCRYQHTQNIINSINESNTTEVINESNITSSINESNITKIINSSESNIISSINESNITESINSNESETIHVYKLLDVAVYKMNDVINIYLSKVRIKYKSTI